MKHKYILIKMPERFKPERSCEYCPVLANGCDTEPDKCPICKGRKATQVGAGIRVGGKIADIFMVED